MTPPATFADVMNQIPPKLALLCGLRARTLSDIQSRTDLPKRKFDWIKNQPNFNRVPVIEADNFLAACGIRPGNVWTHIWYLKRTMTKTARPFSKALRKLPKREQERLAR